MNPKLFFKNGRNRTWAKITQMGKQLWKWNRFIYLLNKWNRFIYLKHVHTNRIILRAREPVFCVFHLFFSYPRGICQPTTGVYVCVLSIFPISLIARFNNLLLLSANIVKSETWIYVLCENNQGEKWVFLNSGHNSSRFLVNTEALAKDWYFPDYSLMDIIPWSAPSRIV